jgi:hypothetical protein
VSTHSRYEDDDPQETAQGIPQDADAADADTAAAAGVVPEAPPAPSPVEDQEVDDTEQDQEETPGFDEVIFGDGVDILYDEDGNIELQTFYPIYGEDGTQGQGVAAQQMDLDDLQQYGAMVFSVLDAYGLLDTVAGQSDDEDDEDDEDDDGERSGIFRRAGRGAGKAVKSSGGVVKNQWNTVANNPSLDWRVFSELLTHRTWLNVPWGAVLLVGCVLIGLYGLFIV